MEEFSQQDEDDEIMEIELEANGHAETEGRRNVPAGRRRQAVVPNYRPGNLIRVEMNNFLTFTKTIFKPGPRMNLVIGPNGTGKSTIVSAVCIVFGGKPSILGRSPDLGAFVKYGTSEASVEAHVYEPSHEKGYISVRREFDNENQSTFYIDGKKVRSIDVQQKVVQRYDIQLDNMSQFMPQEKIAEFTNHKPEELLKLAIRSLGGAEKEEEYFNLVEEDGQLVSQTDSLKKNREHLDKLTQEQEQDHAEVVAYREQQQLRFDLELLRKFRPTVEEIETRFIYAKLRNDMKEIEKEVQELEAQLQQRMAGSVNKCVQDLDAAKSAYSTNKAAAEQCNHRKVQKNEQFNSLNDDLYRKLKALRDVDVHGEKVRKAVEMAEQKLAQAEEAYHNASQISDGELQQKLDDVDERRQLLLSQRHDSNMKIAPLQESIQQSNRIIKHYGQRLRGLADVKKQRLERLRRMRNGEMIIKVADLVEHMREQNAFQRRVYGPVMAEVEVEESYHARILEHSVSGWLCTAFVLESTHDSRILLEECRKQFNGYKPDMMTTPTTRDDEIDYDAINRQQPPFPVDDDLRGLGIQCTVSDIYKAPDAVRAALNAMAGLHNIYVGNEEARQNQEVLRNNVGLPAWYTPETRCMLSGSRYDQSAKNLRIDTTFTYVKGELYKGSMTETNNQREDFKRRIREQEEKLTSYHRQLEDLKKDDDYIISNLRNLDEDARQWMEQRNERRRKKDEMQRAQQHVEDMKDRAARRDETRLCNNLKQEIKDLGEKAMKNVHEFVTASDDVVKRLLKMDEASIKRAIAEHALAVEQAKHEEESKKVGERRAVMEEIRQDRDTMKEEWKRKKTIAQNHISSDDLASHRDRLVPYTKKPLSHLDEDIQSLEAQIQGLSATGRGVIEAYELREQKIKQLHREIQKQEEWFAKRHTDLTRRKSSFLAWLQTGINRMRSKFASLYRRLGCPADIRLLNVDGENSLKELTLQVLVSYRKDTELRPISATANSGGEKMCCTMIFCFSLQLEEERIPPFVMVDELNQGLDPDNEMKIMTMMIEDSGKEMGTQSFVVTPKLLSNLPLGVCTKTHIVFNGHVSKSWA